MKSRLAPAAALMVALVLLSGPTTTRTLAQSAGSRPAVSHKAATQRIDEEYTRIIRQNLQDSRITTELVDHLPASDTVPTPLKFLGRAVGTPRFVISMTSFSARSHHSLVTMGSISLLYGPVPVEA